ncbi:redoxin domain-containing protein [Chitinophaga tropicalis]|uniref:Redoxin domain-containing protein n=1 Tax=Chitinophaga tropicalis TaxID=2683588 RepID=A0A7K1U9T6_9BACT|nr:redoxin domain-containing protein [Chitinophaga tropicalis]MVT10795.1 redoxin domain-containing protein [Chitinophaga tropicalis]
MSITVGTKAPAFSLVNTEKQKVALEDFKGQNLVILFFPMAFTGTCTTELCSVRDSLAIYNGLNTAVVGISVDSPFTLGKFKADQQLNFPLLSDFNKEASQAYGSFYETFVLDLKGVSKRSAFVVDKDGVIRYAQVLDTASDLPDFEAIKSTLTSLQ